MPALTAFRAELRGAEPGETDDSETEVWRSRQRFSAVKDGGYDCIVLGTASSGMSVER